jgi:hypothetical protein
MGQDITLSGETGFLGSSQVASGRAVFRSMATNRDRLELVVCLHCRATYAPTRIGASCPNCHSVNWVRAQAPAGQPKSAKSHAK